MPSNYVRTTQHGSWSPYKLKAAILAVKQGGISTRKAADLFKVPRRTLRRYLDADSESSLETVERNAVGAPPVFPLELEDQLAKYCLDLCNR